MSLNELKLFKNVKITADYSVVHDMDPDTWRQYLTGELYPVNPDWNNDSPEILFSQTVNYYRMPETIRIEGNFDLIRQATYGFLHDPTGVTNPSFGSIFFFVNDVRLLKQHSNQVTAGGDVTVQDVCELDISIDVWSSYGGKFELYDSYVERRHMPRWKNEGTELVPDWKPIYYPNAGQGVDGAYTQEAVEDLTPGKLINLPDPVPDGMADMKFILVTYIDKTSGELFTLIGADVAFTPISGGWDTSFNPVYKTFNTKRYFRLEDVLDGSLFSAASLVAEYVQSIVVLPELCGLDTALEFDWNNGSPYFYFDENTEPFQHFDIVDPTPAGTLVWLRCEGKMDDLTFLMRKAGKPVTVIGPDHDAVGQANYDDEAEPMMYYAPARQRKVVTGMGGTVIDVPDIDAFQTLYRTQNIIDMNTAITLVYGGNDVKTANAIGNMGTTEGATLPIFNSAWKSYEAISKVADNMTFNAKQMQTVGNGIGGSAMSAAGGFLMGGPGGAIMGLASGILGTVTGVYGNDVELDAKRVQIRNSPATVKSGGSGLGAYVLNFIDVWYMTLKMDDQSMEKLRFMYYWFGYHVNRTFKGDIDLHTRTKFDFIKTSRAKVKGDLTAGAAKQIGAIFDQGVTIYHGPEGYALIGTGDMVSNDEVE